MRGLVLGLVLLAAFPRVSSAGPVLEPFIGSGGGGPGAGFTMDAIGAEFLFFADFGIVNGLGTATFAPPHVTRAPATYGPELDSIYTFGPGVLNIRLGWLDEHGVEQVGSFVATIPGLTFRIESEGVPPICDVCPQTVLNAPPTIIGPGSFDPASTFGLGIARQTVGGEMDFLIDEFTGAPGSATRFAGINYLDLQIAVPEPALSSILVMAALGLLRFRRRLG